MMAAREPAADSGTVAGLAEHHRRFLAFLERRVGDRDTAEEILQAAFVRGVERAGDIRDEERAVAWFYRILRRAVVDHWRSRAAERRGAEAFVRELQDAVEPAPELVGELCRCFEPLLGTLKPESEKILRRVDLEEVRPVDFAAEAGITANNAMVRLHRARRALREQMWLSCRTCAEHGCLDCSCSSPAGHEAVRARGDFRQPLRGVRERGRPARASVTPKPNDRPKGMPP